MVKGVNIEGDIVLHNQSLFPLYIPNMKHNFTIEGKQMGKIVETQATWISPNSQVTQKVSLLLETQDIPEIGLTALANGGAINLKVESEFSLGVFSIQKTTEIQKDITKPITSYTSTSVHLNKIALVSQR